LVPTRKGSRFEGNPETQIDRPGKKGEGCLSSLNKGESRGGSIRKVLGEEAHGKKARGDMEKKCKQRREICSAGWENPDKMGGGKKRGCGNERRGGGGRGTKRVERSC